jgi:hypothetical protein
LRNVFGFIAKNSDEPKFGPDDNLKISTPN